PVLLRVGLVLERALHLEVVAPAGELEAVVAEGLGLLGQCFEGQVGPLAGEEAEGARHGGDRIARALGSPDALDAKPAVGSRVATPVLPLIPALVALARAPAPTPLPGDFVRS